MRYDASKSSDRQAYARFAASRVKITSPPPRNEITMLGTMIRFGAGGAFGFGFSNRAW
jgi:hypothetical protein